MKYIILVLCFCLLSRRFHLFSHLNYFSLLVHFIFLFLSILSFLSDKIRTQYVRREDKKYTIFLLPEEKANNCQRDSKCWRMPGACKCIVIDDEVTSMMYTFDRDNVMIGKINFFETLPFLTIDN